MRILCLFLSFVCKQKRPKGHMYFKLTGYVIKDKFNQQYSWIICILNACNINLT